MSILFILGSTNPFPGAAWTRISFFAETWSNKGHEVDVLGTFSYKSLLKRGMSKFGKTNIFNVIFNVNILHPLFFLMNSMISSISTTLFLLAKKPKIAIVSVPTGDVGLGALLACRLIGVKCVVDYRDEWENYALHLASSRIGKSFYSLVKKLAANFYDKCCFTVTVTSNFARLLARRGVTNVRLIPNGADVETFKPLNNKKSTAYFTILYSGGVGGYYRLDVAVKALKKLADNGLGNVKLVIAGEGEVQKILNLALKLNIPRNVDYRGSISDKTELVHLMTESDIGLIPYDNNILWKNSLPAKFFEYCACGIPVIATVYTDSLIAELIKGYDVGAISPPMDEEKLAEAIYQLYKNESFREAAGKRARLLIENKFDRNKLAEDFLTLIRTCF